MSDNPVRNATADDHTDNSESGPAGLAMKDPTDTDHPTGAAQAEENAATESPS